MRYTQIDHLYWIVSVPVTSGPVRRCLRSPLDYYRHMHKEAFRTWRPIPADPGSGGDVKAAVSREEKVHVFTSHFFTKLTENKLSNFEVGSFAVVDRAACSIPSARYIYHDLGEIYFNFGRLLFNGSRGWHRGYRFFESLGSPLHCREKNEGTGEIPQL